MSRFIEALNTSTTVVNVHRGVVLPEARIIVIGVPVVVFCIYWFVLRPRGRS